MSECEAPVNAKLLWLLGGLVFQREVPFDIGSRRASSLLCDSPMLYGYPFSIQNEEDLFSFNHLFSFLIVFEAEKIRLLFISILDGGATGLDAAYHVSGA